MKSEPLEHNITPPPFNQFIVDIGDTPLGYQECDMEIEPEKSIFFIKRRQR